MLQFLKTSLFPGSTEGILIGCTILLFTLPTIVVLVKREISSNDLEDKVITYTMLFGISAVTVAGWFIPVIVASAVFGGFLITIYKEHRAVEKEKRRLYRAQLEKLKSLPEIECKEIL